MTERYLNIGGGYSYAPMRVGLVVQAPNGEQVYVQPGDDETAMRATLEALDEISSDVDEAKHATLCDMALGDYFA